MTKKDRSIKMLKLLKENGYELQDLIDIIEQCNDAVMSEEKATTTNMPLEVRVSELLLKLGVPANILGFKYMKEAVSLVYQNPNLIRHITNELYPGIAQKYNTTISRVERAIRNSVRLTFVCANNKLLEDYFGHIKKNSKVTNSKFIITVAEILKNEDEKVK